MRSGDHSAEHGEAAGDVKEIALEIVEDVDTQVRAPRKAHTALIARKAAHEGAGIEKTLTFAPRARHTAASASPPHAHIINITYSMTHSHERGEDAGTHWFVFCKDDLLLTSQGHVPQSAECPVHTEAWHTVHRLPPLTDDTPCRAVRIDAPVVAEGFRMVGLRASFDLLPAELYAMAGKAREILYWDACTKFCGVCGAPMRLHTDISKRCTNCGKEVWPQLATAIIVAVTRKNPGTGEREILLVQARNFRGDYLGLVAGFVETGETLEECVHREVMEETGIRIRHIRYRHSQPWPYPCGLMVGFTAEYDGGELRLQRSELNKGGWYTRRQLPPIPGKVSLARRLIDEWLEEEEHF